jgi:hypothetical protein
MNIDRAVLALAGTVTLLGLLLAVLFSPWWLLLSAFAGLNQLQASLTGFCPAALVFRRAGLKPGVAFACARPSGESHPGGYPRPQTRTQE